MDRIKKKLSKRKIFLILLLIVVNIVIYSFLYYASGVSGSQKTIKEVSGLSFNSAKDKLEPVFNLPRFHSSFDFKFEADFFPKSDNYDNIFQIGGDPKTLRAELIHPSSLQVIVGYKDDSNLIVIPISNKVKVNAWNHIQLIYSSDQRLYVKLNDELPLVSKDNKYEAYISDLVLGTGYDRGRTFQGFIKNANFKATFNETNDVLFILSLISKYYFMLVFIQLLFLYSLKLRREGIKIKEQDYSKTFFDFIKTFSIIAVILLLIGSFASPLTGNRKWIPYLGLFITSALLGLNYIKLKWFNEKYFLVIAGIISFIVLSLGINNYIGLSWLGSSSLLIIICFLCLMPLSKRFSLISLGISVFLFGINSVIRINSFSSHNYIWMLFVVLIIVLAFIYLLYGKEKFKWATKINRLGFFILLAISFLLSLRSDSLFLGSSELHWSYFIGVIQTLRSGGELLWNTPSQYGFLNIQIPSFFPWTSRNSLFIFQALLFFMSSFIIIKTTYLFLKNKIVFIPISLAALSLFFFADPAIIGPTLYPSSSVMRFFWCYALLFLILLGYYKRDILNGRVKWIITGAYIMGSLWSAESMLYSTSIYGTYMLTSTIAMYKLKSNYILKFLLKNIAVIVFACIAFNAIYILLTKHLPDWSMYFMYVLNYAEGYGEFVIRPGGIYWAIIIALSSIVFVLAGLYSKKRYSEWIIISVCFSSLWIVTSYYIGRAVTNNITALLPLVFYIFLVAYSVLMEAKFFNYRILITSVILPWVIAGVIGGIGNPQFPDKLQEFRYAENINSKSFKPDKDLSSVLKSLKVTNDTRIAYYGDPYDNPIISTGKGGEVDSAVGIPLPMALLEEPISEHKRDIILGRFFSDINESVYLIHKKSENMERFQDWENFLKGKFIYKPIRINNEKYEVFSINGK